MSSKSDHLQVFKSGMSGGVLLSDARIKLGILIFSLAGAIDAAYLTWVKLMEREVFCGGSGECATVSNSPYAEIGGIPVALLGLGAYLALIGLVYLENRGRAWRQYAPLAVFAISLAGVIYSAYLTYLEIAVIRAICPYCVVSAIIMLVIFVLAMLRVLREPAVD